MKKNIYFRMIALLLCVLILSGCTADTAAPASSDNPSDSVASEGLEEYTERNYFFLTYKNTENGRIEGELEQQVEQGGSGTNVVAVPDEGYLFISWSDGRTIATRRDAYVKEDITVYPIFMKEGAEFTVRYEIMRDGALVEAKELSAKVGETVKYEADEPAFAYELVWSDGKEGAVRVDNALLDGQTIVGSHEPKSLGIPAICINTDDGRGIDSKTTYKGCTVSLKNADAEYCFESVDADVRGRGNSSWSSHDKNSYRIKFKEKRSMMGTDYSARSWTVIANHADKTLSRNAIAYEFSSLLPSIEFSSIREFVDLYVNGEYLGVYLLCDQIQTGEGRVEVDRELTGDTNTGYMIEIDNRAPDEGKLGYHYFKAIDGKTYTIKTPDPDDEMYDPKYLKYIEDYVNEALDALNSKDWNRICEYIEVDTFVDGYLAQELFCNLDCHSFSFFLCKDKDGKLYSGPVWDYDIGSGNNNYGLGNEEECLPDQDLIDDGKLWVARTHQWYKRLLKVPEYVELVKKKLVEYKDDFEYILDLISTDPSIEYSYYSMYGEAMERNFERWDILNRYIWPNPNVIVRIDTLKGQLDYLHEWLTERYRIVCEVYGVTP